MAETDRVTLAVNGSDVTVDVPTGATLLHLLREQLGLVSAKDGCAPQGQCGCCTVLVDGSPRIACVTPAVRVQGRSVTTVEGLPEEERSSFGSAFCATGGSQCGFCTPGIVMRAAGLARRGRTARRQLDQGLAAHLCRCTGWLTVYEAIDVALDRGSDDDHRPRDLAAASRRAELEGATPQTVGPEVPVGGGGFADDTAPRDALVAVPSPPGSDAEAVEVGGLRWVVGESLHEARRAAGKVQGRNAPADLEPPVALPPRPEGGVRLATSWVEPAYLEPDASWCEPGGEPADPLANGGAFGGKLSSPAPAAARGLADRFGRPVRVVLSREDVVRLGPKRPPVSASAVLDASVLTIRGAVASGGVGFARDHPWLYDVAVRVDVDPVEVAGPPVSDELRASGWAEQVLLVEGALEVAGAERSALVERAGRDVLLDTCVAHPDGARAGARVEIGASGRVERVHVRVDAGDPLDETVLRSYVLGGAHMGLGWVLSEGVAVDPDSGEVLDLTIRSFGIVRAKDTPPIDVEIVGRGGPPRPRAGDAAFAAVAAAAWNALARAEAGRPEHLPARATRAARALRR